MPRPKYRPFLCPSVEPSDHDVSLFQGLWSLGRPDLALLKFGDAILDGRTIDIFSLGQMYRDFTYIDDMVRAIRLPFDCPPFRPERRDAIEEGDSLSPAAPFGVVSISNLAKVRLLDFLEAIEAELQIKAIRNYMPMQKGDVPATWADASLLQKLAG